MILLPAYVMKKILQVHTATLSCNCCLLFLFFTSLRSYFLNYVFVSPLAQELCQAGCLHSAPFTYLPTSPYSLLYNGKSTRVMCQITFPSLFFPALCQFPSSKWHTEAEDIPLCKWKTNLKHYCRWSKWHLFNKEKKRERQRGERGSLTKNPAICMNQALWFTSKSIKVHLITHSLDRFPPLSYSVFPLCERHFLTAIKHQTSHWSATVSWYMVSMCVSDIKCHDERTSHLRVSVTQHTQWPLLRTR